MQKMNETTDKHRTTRPRWRRWVLDVGLVFIVVFAVQAWQTRSMPVGKAPTLEGSLLSGQKVSLQDFRGNPVLVHFWATWCPVCRTEEGNIQNVAKDYRVLSVAMTSGAANEVSKYMRENGLDFPVLVDESGLLSVAWGVRGVPSSFIIDANGKIRHLAVGYTTELGLRFRLWLAGWRS